MLVKASQKGGRAAERCAFGFLALAIVPVMGQSLPNAAMYISTSHNSLRVAHTIMVDHFTFVNSNAIWVDCGLYMFNDSGERVP